MLTVKNHVLTAAQRKLRLLCADIQRLHAKPHGTHTWVLESHMHLIAGPRIGRASLAMGRPMALARLATSSSVCAPRFLLASWKRGLSADIRSPTCTTSQKPQSHITLGVTQDTPAAPPACNVGREQACPTNTNLGIHPCHAGPSRVSNAASTIPACRLNSPNMIHI